MTDRAVRRPSFSEAGLRLFGRRPTRGVPTTGCPHLVTLVRGRALTEIRTRGLLLTMEALYRWSYQGGADGGDICDLRSYQPGTVKPGTISEPSQWIEHCKTFVRGTSGPRPDGKKTPKSALRGCATCGRESNPDATMLAQVPLLGRQRKVRDSNPQSDLRSNDGLATRCNSRSANLPSVTREPHQSPATRDPCGGQRDLQASGQDGYAPSVRASMQGSPA